MRIYQIRSNSIPSISMPFWSGISVFFVVPVRDSSSVRASTTLPTSFKFDSRLLSSLQIRFKQALRTLFGFDAVLLNLISNSIQTSLQNPLNLMPNKFLSHNDNYIICSTHGALFEIETGLCISGPCINKNLAQIPATIKNNALFIKIP